jgi:hypothetical protein
VSSPSNPTGRVLPESWLAALAEWAEREGVWLISDEVYEDFVYRGAHVSTARFLPERTLSVFSFSKAYGMAGNRTGYLVAPEAAVTQALKISTHTFYAAPTSGQFAGLRALRDGANWIARARASYEEVGRARPRGSASPRPRARLPVPRRVRADRRARHLGLPRGLHRRRRRARAGPVVRARLRELGAALLHRRAARSGARGGRSPRGAAALTGVRPARRIQSSIASIASSSAARRTPRGAEPARDLVRGEALGECDERVREVGRVADEHARVDAAAARGRR